MNKIPIEVTRMSMLPECWLYREKKYIYVRKSVEHNLPTIEALYEPVLINLGISYRKTLSANSGEILEYWDKENYSEKELTLPVYIKTSNNSYRYVKNYTGKGVTQETIEAAEALTYDLKCAALRYDDINEITSLLEGKKAVVVEKRFCSREDFIFNDLRFKILPVNWKDSWNDEFFSKYCAIFDVNQIKLNDVLDIEVPAGTAGLVVGKSGWQVKDWCKKLGLKRINVVEI